MVQQFQPRVANFGIAYAIHLNGCKGMGPTASCLELLPLLIWSFFMQISSKKNPNCVVISIFGMEDVVRNRRSPKCFQGSISSFGSTPQTNQTQTQTSFNSSSTYGCHKSPTQKTTQVDEITQKLTTNVVKIGKSRVGREDTKRLRQPHSFSQRGRGVKIICNQVKNGWLMGQQHNT